MSSCFLDVLCNDGDSVNFSSSQLELGKFNISADDGDVDSVAAGLAGVKPNAESFMQELASCFLIFLCSICCYETLSVT